MRKFFVPSALLSLSLLLIIFSDVCIVAAQNALDAWWNHVLPALLPFSLFLSLSNQSGAFYMLEKLCYPLAKKLHVHAAVFSCVLFGMLSGYPNGARLCSMRGIPHAAAFCSFCSPVFLIGVVAHGLYGNSQFILPLLIAHVGSAFLTVLPQIKTFQTKSSSKILNGNIPEKTENFFKLLLGTLQIMASIGGCMVLFSVGVALIENTQLLHPFAAVLSPFSITEQYLLAFTHGFFEFAGGCVSIAALDLPIRIRLSLTAFTVSFGGLCVCMQSAMFLDKANMCRYFRIKLMQGILASVLAYVLYPYFCSKDIPVVLSTDMALDYAANALSMGSIFMSSCIVLAAFYLFALALYRLSQENTRKKAHHTASL